VPETVRLLEKLVLETITRGYSDVNRVATRPSVAIALAANAAALRPA
jgi:hypothetical protein